ncbi:IS3 family transposase, partial [Escherichia coli]
ISREIMRATVFNYIECDYNRWRRHSWCGGLSPEQFENQNLAKACVHITWVGSNCQRL